MTDNSNLYQSCFYSVCVKQWPCYQLFIPIHKYINDDDPSKRFQMITITINSLLYCSPFNNHSSNFAIAKLELLIHLLQFLYKFCRLVHGFFSVLLSIRLSLFQLLRQRRVKVHISLSPLRARKSNNFTFPLRYRL